MFQKHQNIQSKSVQNDCTVSALDTIISESTYYNYDS